MVSFYVRRVGCETGTYNGYLSAELVLDLSLLIGIRTLILDDLEELFDSHLGGGCRSVVLEVSMMWDGSRMLGDAIDRACFARAR